jgi:hypothetical protein
MDLTGSSGASFGAASVSISIAGTGANTVLTAADFTSGTLNTDKGLQIFTEALPVIASIDLGTGSKASVGELIQSEKRSLLLTAVAVSSGL